uniref:Serine/threonine-protein kinase ATM n=1 Tax=Anopheles minimus TaxID=112268 RepID=A0A182VTU2_9DIPT
MDSFFGFNANHPLENDDDEEFGQACPKARTVGLRSPLQRRCKEEMSDEEEYDALNDETFGAADKGDWEDIHENLVRLERGRNGRGDSFPGDDDDDDDGSSADLLFDYDIDLQLSKLTLYDTNDESGRSSAVAQSIGDEFASKLRLDPSIWGSPLKAQPSAHQKHAEQKPYENPFASQQPSLALKPPEPPSSYAINEPKPSRRPELFPQMKMLSVEDIERSIIQKQHQQNQQSLHLLQKQITQPQQPLHPLRQSTTQPLKSRDHFPSTKDVKPVPSMPLIAPSVAQPLGVPPVLMSPPPHLLAARNCALFPPGPPPAPLLNHPNCLPLGMMPYNMLATRPYSTPINNLAMHPAFPPRCPYGSPMQGFLVPPLTIPPPLPQRHPGPPGPFMLQRSSTPLQNNQFNQRLVQEIQQNHPMLAFNRQLASTFNACQNGIMKNVAQNQQRPPLIKQMHYPPQQRSRLCNGLPEAGGPTRERDEYANMMSTRDKQWLIGIQLTQLNSDLPYLNDYYFTVYKQRLAAAKGDNGNRIYKANQLNHPFVQPTEHAQLLLLSMLTKNVKGGLLHLNRERRSSESKSTSGSDGKDGSVTGRAYTPFQFEKSLGKLQCGSVTAPRKLIDADVMGSDQLNGNPVTTAEQTLTQRKARHVLLLIETLYKLLLKLEDKLNPVAIATADLLREKKMRERNVLCEAGIRDSQDQLTILNGTATSGNGIQMELEESFEELSASLIRQLSQEKITSILGVRKGRILLRRSLTVLHDHPARWKLWGMIFTALPSLAKRDREDADGLLLALFSEFERQLRYGRTIDLLQVARTIGASRKVMQCIVSSKFLLSCIITIIFQMEMFCGKNPATLLTGSENDWWISFLEDVNQVVKDKVGSAHSSISINPDNNIVRTLRLHFARFGTRVDGADLMNFITDNGNNQHTRSLAARKQSLQETNITNGSRLSVMDRELCSLLVEMASEKITVRQKAFGKMSTIFNNREEDFLAYMSSDSFETAWSALYEAAFSGIQKQSCTNKGQTQSKNHDYLLVLNKLIELAMDREAPQLSFSQLIGSFVHTVNDQAMRENFGVPFLQVLTKYVLSSKWCLTTITHEQWKDIFDSCFVMIDSSQAAKGTALSSFSLAVVKFLDNCSKQTLLAAYLSRLMDHIRQMANEKKINVLYELIKTALLIVQAITVDCKTKTIQFLEALIPYTVKIYKENNPRNEQKSTLFRLMHLSLIILYPQGKSLAHAKSLTKDCLHAGEDNEECRKTLREYHYIVTCEMKTRDQASSHGAKEIQFCDGFIDFAARLCYTVYWNEDNWKETGNSDETAVKRNKQFNKLQSVLDMIGSAPNQYNSRWLFILAAILERYEAAIHAEDYMPVLHLLCNIQPTLQSPMEQKAFYQCCTGLLNYEQKPTYRSLIATLKREQQELWNKIIAAAFRGCTNTNARTSSEYSLLLQLLIRHRKYPDVRFLNGTVLEAFYTYAVQKTNVNVGTVLCILDTVGSVECLGNVDDVSTKLFNYLYPQTRETKSKAILHAKERLSAKTLAHISVLCVVTKRSSTEKDSSSTKKAQHSVKHFYQEQDKQMQTLEQILRLHSLDDLIALEERRNQTEVWRAAEKIYFNVNEPLFSRLCEVVSFDNHVLSVDNDFLVDGVIRICYDLELYLEMINVLLIHEAYNEEQCNKNPLYKKILFKFDQLNQGFERLLQNDAPPNENETNTISERLLAIYRGPYHQFVKKLIQNKDHTLILRWTIGQIDTAEREDSQCVAVLQADQLSSEQQWHRCLYHIIAEYLQYDGPCTDTVHDLLDKLTLNVYNSLDLFYIFDMCDILLKQTSHELVAVWVLRNIVDVCKTHYTDPAITEMIIDRYADLTSFVSPYEEMVRNVTIVLYSFVKQCAKHTYSTQLQVKIFAQVKYLLKAYPQHIRTQTHEHIYTGLVPLLSSSCYRIKLEAVRNVLHFMNSNWAYNDGASIPSTFYEFQMHLYGMINFDELISAVSDEDEKVNMISCCLQLLLGIFRTSFLLRRRALCDCVLLIQSGNVNDDKMAITMRIACSTGDIDFRKLLQAHLDSVLGLWLSKGNRLIQFPYRISGKLRSIEEFVQHFKKNIAYVILCMQPEQFEQFCKSIGVQQTDMVKSIVAKCVSFLLPKYAKCDGMAPKYNVMAGRMHKALAPFLNTMDLKEHVTEIIMHLTYRLNDSVELGKLADLDLPSCSVDDLFITKATYATALEHLKQSVWGSSPIKYTLLSNLCLKNSSSIERTLTEVKRCLWTAEECEQKLVHLFQYTEILNHLKEYIGQQKERSFKPYLVRDVVYFLCNLLVSFPTLRLATLNSLEHFLGNVLTSNKKEIKMLCEELSDHSASSTVDGESVLHRLVYILLEVVRSSTFDKRSIEALRCLGEIGPIDLGTMLLKTDGDMIAYDTINEFFSQFNAASSEVQYIFNDPKAIQLMLTIVECGRIHSQLFPQYKLSINYLPIAQASQFCQAHFKAILYGELWYREAEEKEKGAGKKHPKLLEIMKSCHLAVGVNDAVRSFLKPIHDLMEYYRLDQNYAKCLVMQDATMGWRESMQQGTSQSFLQTLKDSCLYGLARSLREPQQIDYECAWRLSDWDVVIDTDGSDAKRDTVGINALHVQLQCFERAHYTALKCLNLRDELAVESAIVKAQQAISEMFKLTSIESTKYIYHALCRLRMLQQIEDFGEIHFAKHIDCEPDMLQKWKEQDELPHSEFTLMESILSQRLSIFGAAGIRAKRKWVPSAVYSTLLLLIHESRLRGYDDCAIRNAVLIGKEELPANVKSIVMLENAQLNWTSGHRVVARELVSEVVKNNEYNDPMVKAVACRLYAEFQAESHLQEIKSLCTDYFQHAEKCVTYVLSRENNDQKTVPGTISSTHRCFESDRTFTVQHTVAKYADREFVRLSKFFRSQEWEARKSNTARMEEETSRMEAEKAQTKDQRHKELSRSLRVMHQNLVRDKKAAAEVEQTRWDYLILALSYYLMYAKQTTIVSDMVIFRIISLWLNNQENKEACSLIEESLLTIPSYKFIAVLPQLTPRVGVDGAVGALVQKALIRCAKDHPHHTLPFVFAQLHAFKDRPDNEAPANDNRLLGVREVYNKLKREPALEKMLEQTERMNLALIELANKTLSSNASFREYTMTKRDPLGMLQNLDLIHCPTIELPVVKDGNYRARIVGIKRWDPKIIGVGGINAPKKLTCLCLNGTKRTQLLKGKDDMRQDAVMQQVFGILNILLRHDKDTAHRKLSVRTYKVVPLSQQSGILEWCNNTMPIGAWLLNGHVKYRPQDIEPTAARKKYMNNAQAGMTLSKKLQNYKDICEKIEPVFRHYFLEQYPKPGVWFERQQHYIKSVAANSMIGYVLGIGDRHVQNILIDKLTGEVIHIDFGIAFEMGKNLPTPETVPFRLTRDIVDGMGISGTEGVFKKSCEKTLEVLRNNQTVILAILEVLLFDPLYSWNVLSNKKANRRQQQAFLAASTHESEDEEPVGLPIREDINVTAERTLIQVEEKLLGQEDNKYISVEGQVQMLIFNATNVQNLCQVFAGWQPYL